MTEWALVKISSGELLLIQQRPNPDPDPGFPEDVSAKDKRWHLVVRTARPTITSAQVADASNAVVGTDYVFGWAVRNKTQAELDADAAANEADKTRKIDDNVDAMVGKALFKIVNEIRALQSQAALTPAQFKVWFRNQQP